MSSTSDAFSGAEEENETGEGVGSVVEPGADPGAAHEGDELAAGSPGAPPDHTSLQEPGLFEHYEYVPPPRPARRKPDFGDLLLFAVLAFGASLCSGIVALAAVHFHLLGVSTLKQANEEIHYRIGTQAAWYIITLVFCVWIFPVVWRKSFFTGLEWRADAARHRLWRLVGAALGCFAGAILDQVLMPGPENAPIDQTFHIPGAVWLLFAFGVTLAPLMEEITYRGLLLPALCTSYDWTAERLGKASAPGLDENGSPRWSMAAMVAGSVLASVPFALMHGEQTAYSMGPFLMLFCISLVLCWIRLAMRSLAASVVVHSAYNLLLFSFMAWGTGGFKHLERM